MDAGIGWIFISMLTFFIGMWVTSLWYRSKGSYETFNVMVNCDEREQQRSETEGLRKDLTRLREIVEFRGRQAVTLIEDHLGHVVDFRACEEPTPQLKDRIRLIEEMLGIEYEQVPAKPEVPATWRVKKTKKRRAA